MLILYNKWGEKCRHFIFMQSSRASVSKDLNDT
jgi:hypothetical protein